MSYNKKINKVLFMIFLLLFIYFIKNVQTYSKYNTENDGRDSTTVAQWNVKIGKNNMNNGYDFSNELVLKTENNKNVIEGKIAPGTSISTQFSLDCSECETSLKYIVKPSQIKCDEREDSRFIVASIDNEKNTMQYDEEQDYYFGIVDTRDTYKIINIKATVNWKIDDENNEADTESGVENSIIILPLTVRVEQMN